MSQGRIDRIRLIQLVLILATLLFTASWFGGVGVVGEALVTAAGGLLLLSALYGTEADGRAEERGRTAGERWRLWIAAVAALVVLQLIPLPSWVRRVAAPVGEKLLLELEPNAADGLPSYRAALVPSAEVAAPTTTDAIWTEGQPSAPTFDSTAIQAPARLAGWRPLSMAPGATLSSLGLLIGYAGIFLAAVGVHRRERYGRWLRIGVIGTVFVVAVVAMVGEAMASRGIANSLMRARGAAAYGSFANRNHFSALLGLILPWAVFECAFRVRALADRRVPQRITREVNEWALVLLWGFASIVMAVAMVRSLSRAGLLAVAVAIVAGGLLAFRGWSLKVAGLALALALAISVAAMPLLEGREAAIADRLEQGGAIRSAEMRGELSMAAVRHWLHYPLLGSGLGSFPWASDPIKPPTGNVAMERAHNDWLEWVGETGLVGAALLAIGIFLLASDFRVGFRSCRESYRRILAGLACGLGSLALHEAVDFNLQLPAVAVLSAVLAGSAVGIARSGYRLLPVEDGEAP